MPVDREYGNLLLAGLVANQAGLGQGTRLDRQQALREQQVAQAAEMDAARLAEQSAQANADRELKANLAALQDSRFRQQQGLAFTRDRADAQARQWQDQVDFQQQFALNEQNQLGMLDRMGLQNQFALDATGLEYEVDAATAADANAKDALGEYRKMNLRPEGQQLLQEYSGKIRALQGQKLDLRPQAYAQAMGELISDFDNSGIEDFEVKDLSKEEKYDRYVIWEDDYNMLLEGPDGKPSLQGKVIPKEPPAAKPVDPDKVTRQTPKGEMPRSTARDVASTGRAKAEADLLNEWKAGPGKAAEPGTLPTFTDKQIIEKMRRNDAIEDAYLNGEDVPSEKPKAPPRSEITVVMPPESAAMDPTFNGWFKHKDGVYYKALSPEEVANLPPGTKVVTSDGRTGTTPK